MTVAVDRTEIQWTAVCPYPRLAPDRGVAALVGGAQVAIFRTSGGEVFAIAHQDPVNGAHVMSRGIVGARNGRPTIASPTLRHVYDLRTGDCLDIPGLRVPVYPVRCRDGVVEVGIVSVATNRGIANNHGAASVANNQGAANSRGAANNRGLASAPNRVSAAADKAV